VSPARLEVPWEDVEEHTYWDKRFKALKRAPEPTEHEAEAILDVLFLVLKDDTINMWGGESTGIAYFNDLAVVRESTAMKDPELLEDPLTITKDGWTYVPWSVTEKIVRAVARKNAATVLQFIDKEERKAERDSILGTENRWTRNDPIIEVSGETHARYFREHTSKVHAILREWVGADLTEQHDDLTALQSELSRVGDIAQRAIADLKKPRPNRTADALQRELLNPPSKWHGYGVDAEEIAPYRTPYKWVLRDLPSDNESTCSNPDKLPVLAFEPYKPALWAFPHDSAKGVRSMDTLGDRLHAH
jgi:hypothetical protein